MFDQKFDRKHIKYAWNCCTSEKLFQHLAEFVGNLGQRMDRLEDLDLDKYADTIKEIQSDISSLESSIAQVQTTATGNTEAIVNLLTDLETLTGQVDALAEGTSVEMDDLEQQINDTAETITDIQILISNIQTKLNTMEEDYETLENSVDTLGTTVSNGFDTVNERIDSVVESQDTWNESITSQLEDLIEHFGDIEDLVYGFNSDIVSMKSDITSLEDSVNTVTDKCEELDDRVTTLENEESVDTSDIFYKSGDKINFYSSGTNEYAYVPCRFYYDSILGTTCCTFLIHLYKIIPTDLVSGVTFTIHNSLTFIICELDAHAEPIGIEISINSCISIDYKTYGCLNLTFNTGQYYSGEEFNGKIFLARAPGLVLNI